MGPQTRIGDPDYPLMGGLKTQFHVTNQRDEEKPTPTSSPEARTSVASRAFPHITPPSAESLMEGAPASVLEAELRRLLGDWTAGLEVLGEIFEQDLAGSSSAGGSAGVSKRHGKGAEEEEEEEEEQREEES